MYATCASPSLTDSRARARFLCILCVFRVGHVVDDSDADDEDRDNVEGSCSYPFLLLLLFLPVFTRQLLKEDDFCCAHSRCLWSIVHSSRDLWHIVKRILGESSRKNVRRTERVGLLRCLPFFAASTLQLGGNRLFEVTALVYVGRLREKYVSVSNPNLSFCNECGSAFFFFFSRLKMKIVKNSVVVPFYTIAPN